jgi:hypothetical protein
LDIDGVLNSYRNILAYDRWPHPDVESEAELDPIAIAMVRRLCKITNTSIILSSTWREHVIAVNWGKKHDLPIIGATREGSKSYAISDWLSYNPQVRKYAIIDDDDMHDKEHQIWTTLTNGMQYEHYRDLKALLEDEPKPESSLILTEYNF